MRYRYAAGGATYNGDRFRFQFMLLRDRMESRDRELTLGRYRVGERVKVAVNPRDPSDSVLEPGPDLEGILPLGAGLFLILAGIGEVQKKTPLQPEVYLGPPGPRYRTAKIMAADRRRAISVWGLQPVGGIASSLRWPTADGRILYSQARTGGTYETLLWYEYYVSGTRYLAGKYRTGGNVTPFQDVAVAAAKRSPAGRAVKVYYNPRNPGEALLEPGIWYGNFVAPAVAALVLGSGVAGEEVRRGDGAAGGAEVTAVVGILVQGDNHSDCPRPAAGARGGAGPGAILVVDPDRGADAGGAGEVAHQHAGNSRGFGVGRSDPG